MAEETPVASECRPDTARLARPQRDMMYAGGMISVDQFISGPGGLNADVAVEEGEAGHVVR
jgi:hypothetical protein